MRTYFGLAVVALAAVVAIQERSPQGDPTAHVTFAFNEQRPTLGADTLSLISFGYPRIFSNLLWLRFLQSTSTERVPAGELSWMYFDLDSVSTIDPDFVPVFEQAAPFLSVVTEDKAGARLLLEKGTRIHPERWRIRSFLAYHYQFELAEPELAAQQYLAASKLEGAPSLMGLLAARHMAKTQSIQHSIDFLESLKQNANDPLTRKRFEERIELWKNKLRDGGQS